MDLWISNSGGVPIYEQIVNQIKGLVLSGALKEGDTLPSMRLLAKELHISVITTKRAYEELEREGFIVSITGKGSYVAYVDVSLVREQQLREVETLLQQAAEKARIFGIPQDELIEMLHLQYLEE